MADTPCEVPCEVPCEAPCETPECILKPYLKCAPDIKPRSDNNSGAPDYYTPLQLADLYNFPKTHGSETLDGTGQTIGIIQLGGSYKVSDMTYFFKNLLKFNTVPNIVPVKYNTSTRVWQENTLPAWNSRDDANSEVALDVQIIGAIAPKATLRVYFGDYSATYEAFYNTIEKAINDNCNIVSISWGATEYQSSQRSATDQLAFDAMFQRAAQANISLLCASGDNGASDGRPGLNVDFPASSPNILACGGTNLLSRNGGDTFVNETVWNNNNGYATGGGISKVFAEPSYQAAAVKTVNLKGKRGVPDVAGHADPQNIPYGIYYGGKLYGVGGTSAVAPLYAGLYARLNQAKGSNVGFLNSAIYNHARQVCRDVTQGNNNDSGAGFSAIVGWDACTGCGVINGTNLLTLIVAPETIPETTPETTPVPTPAPTPKPGPTITPKFNVTLPSRGYTVTFVNNTTTVKGNIYQWNFGDGTKNYTTIPKKSFTYNFKRAGKYTVTMKVKNTKLGINKHVTIPVNLMVTQGLALVPIKRK